MTQGSDHLMDKLRRHADLGHAKRDSALLRQVGMLCSSPGASIPQSAGKVAGKGAIADATSFYRFVGNEDLPIRELRSIRANMVLEGIPTGSDVLILHDMSPLDFSRHNSKEDRRPIGDHKGMGYEYVANVAVDPKEGRVLGLVHDTVISAEGPDDRDVMNYEYEELFADFSEDEKRRLRDNHRHQMAVHINGTAGLLDRWHVIDVADREFDDIFVLDRCRENKRDLVIRSSANRNVQIRRYDWIPGSAITSKQSGHALREDHVCVNLARLIEHVPLQPYKSLPLDPRGRVVRASRAKRFANLSIGAISICVYRAAQRNRQYVTLTRPLDVNLVVIRELHPPAREEPLCWVLLTSLPVETTEQIAYVGEIYEQRWLIEEYFRLLKSGYNVLHSRLDGADKIARALVLCSMAAMTVLHLKRDAGLPPEGDLNDANYQRLKAAAREPNNDQIDLNLRLFARIATLGGWLGRRRDPIGPTVLMRGMLAFLAAADAITQFAPLIQEALQNPDALGGLLTVLQK